MRKLIIPFMGFAANALSTTMRQDRTEPDTYLVVRGDVGIKAGGLDPARAIRRHHTRFILSSLSLILNNDALPKSKGVYAI